MGVVRLRPTELVVGHGRGARQHWVLWTTGQVLELAAPAQVADEDEELPVSAEGEHATVVVAALDSI